MERVFGEPLVILVDDEPCVLSTLAAILAWAGCRVLRAESSSAALAIAESMTEPLDLLITDVVMPGLRGPALAKRIMRLHPEGRVLFIAGLADTPEIQEEVVRLGLPLLPKPFRPDALIEAVRDAMLSPVNRIAVAPA